VFEKVSNTETASGCCAQSDMLSGVSSVTDFRYAHRIENLDALATTSGEVANWESLNISYCQSPLQDDSKQVLLRLDTLKQSNDTSETNNTHTDLLAAIHAACIGFLFRHKKRQARGSRYSPFQPVEPTITSNTSSCRSPYRALLQLLQRSGLRTESDCGWSGFGVCVFRDHVACPLPKLSLGNISL
jgi:hypothetical protein